MRASVGSPAGRLDKFHQCSKPVSVTGGVGLFHRAFVTYEVDNFPFEAELASRGMIYPILDRCLPEPCAQAIAAAGYATHCQMMLVGLIEPTITPVDVSDYRAYRAIASDWPVYPQALVAVDGSWAALFSEEHVGLLAGRAGFIEQLSDDPGVSPMFARARSELERDVAAPTPEGWKLLDLDPLLQHLDGAQRPQ